MPAGGLLPRPSFSCCCSWRIQAAAFAERFRRMETWRAIQIERAKSFGCTPCEGSEGAKNGFSWMGAKFRGRDALNTSDAAVGAANSDSESAGGRIAFKSSLSSITHAMLPSTREIFTQDRYVLSRADDRWFNGSKGRVRPERQQPNRLHQVSHRQEEKRSEKPGERAGRTTEVTSEVACHLARAKPSPQPRAEAEPWALATSGSPLPLNIGLAGGLRARHAGEPCAR